MRICLYTDTALPKLGGQELVVDALARQFLALGHEVVVLAPYPRRSLRINDASLPYRVVRHPRFYSTRYLVAWYRRWLLRLHRTYRFEVLHCHGIYPPGYLAALGQARLEVPIVITSHGGDLKEGNGKLTREGLQRRHVQALRAADALVAISRFTHDGFLRLGSADSKIVTIPNGVDLEPFATPASRPERLDPAIQTGEYLLFLGRLKHRKGVDLLLQALALVPRKGRVQLAIAGDGEERRNLEAQSQRLGLANRVRFLGRILGSAKTYLLQNALCTVMPSRQWEAFPLVVLESYAAGTPVIGTAIPGLGNLIQPGRTGMVVPPESPAALAGALDDLLDDPAGARKLGHRARQVAQNHSWDLIARRHLQLYQQLHACQAGSRVFSWRVAASSQELAASLEPGLSYASPPGHPPDENWTAPLPSGAWLDGEDPGSYEPAADWHPSGVEEPVALPVEDKP